MYARNNDQLRWSKRRSTLQGFHWKARQTWCCLATFFKYLITSKLAVESRPLVGSSKNRIFGPVIKRLAILKRRFWPPLMPFLIGVPTRVLAWSRSPNEVSISSTRCRRSWLETELPHPQLPVKHASQGIKTYLGNDSRAAKSSVSRTVKEPMRDSSCST